MIDLWLGQPHPSILEKARQAIVEHCVDPLKQPDSSALLASLNYGENAGEPGFVASLVQWLNATIYQQIDRVAVDQVFVTNGASQALLMLARTLCSARGRRVVYCEEATYFLALDVFVHDLQLSVRGVPTDDDGIVPAALEQMLAGAAADSLPAFIYVIPSHHNPTARTVSDARRRQLVAIAREHDIAIVADDPYCLLSFAADSAPAPTPMSSLGYRFVYDVGSFSKILAPGVRLGWLRTTDTELIADLCRNDGLVQSGGGLAPFSSVFLQPLLVSGALAQFGSWLRSELRQRCAALCDALQTAIDARRDLGDHVYFSWPRGGYFVWLHVGADAGADVAERALARGVRALPGTRCLAERRAAAGACAGQRCRRAECCVRLCFAWVTRDELIGAARSIVEAIVSARGAKFH